MDIAIRKMQRGDNVKNIDWRGASIGCNVTLPRGGRIPAPVRSLTN